MPERFRYQPFVIKAPILPADHLYIVTRSLRPRVIILTRFYTGDMETFITSQKILGKFIPCRFINFNELVDTFSAHGYSLTYKENDIDESLQGVNFKKISKNLRKVEFLNLIFQLSQSGSE